MSYLRTIVRGAGRLAAKTWRWLVRHLRAVLDRAGPVAARAWRWLAGRRTLVLFLIGLVLGLGALSQLLGDREPRERTWPLGAPPSFGFLLPEEYEHDEANVDVRYTSDGDRLSIGVKACDGLDRLGVAFAETAEPDVVEAADATWQRSDVPADAISIRKQVVVADDGASALFLDAPVDDPSCVHQFWLELTGFGIATSRGGQTLIETPTVSTCVNAPVGTVSSDGMSVFDGVERRWRDECTLDLNSHAVRVDPEQGQRLVWSKIPPVSSLRPYHFAEGAQVVLIDPGELSHIRSGDVWLGVLLGVGVTFVAEALLRWITGEAKRARSETTGDR